jgi:hypothetical protein
MEQNGNLRLSDEEQKMKRWQIVTPLALASVVSIAYFTAGPRVPMDGDTTSAAAIAEKANQDTLEEVKGGFGSDVALGDGLILNVTDPAVFAAKDPTALGVEGRPMIMDITIKNNGSKEADLASFAIIQSAFDADATQSCSDVFEEASGVVGLPMDTIVKPGKSLSFKWAIVCPTKSGDGLHLTFSATGNEQITLDSTVK